MLDEILESVKQAENEARAIVTAAEEEAARTLEESDRKVEAMWSDGKERAKSRRAGALSEAEVHATGLAEHVAAEYAEQCRALRAEGLTKVDGLVDYLTEIIFNGGC